MSTFVCYLSDVRYLATSDSTGNYPCPCAAHNGDVNQLFTLQELKTHFRELELALPPTAMECVAVISQDLIDTETLRRLGLCINTTHKLLICISCATCIPPGHAKSHVHTKHSALAKFFDAQALTALVDRFGVHKDFPPIPTSMISEIQGLALVGALGCPLCPAVYPKMSSMQRHHRSAHSDATFKPDTYDQCYAQHYSNGAHSTYFAVMPEPLASRTSFDAELSRLADGISQLVKLTAPATDIRNVAPWLRATKWNVYVQPYDHVMLRALAATPLLSEFPILGLALSRLLREASDLIDSTPTLVLQILNTPHPQKTGISNQPFSKHQDHAARMAQYIYPPLRLLAMLLRPNDVYKIVLPDDVSASVSKMRHCLAAGDLESSVQAVFEVLYKIWTRQWKPTAEQPIVDPTVHFLMLSTLGPDGGFMEPHLITSTLARVEYIMRLVFLQAMHAADDLEKEATVLAAWYREKVESTFNTVCSLQHLLSSVAYATVGLPRVWWTDKETHRALLYHGSPISINGITSMLSALELEMQDIWENDILMGLNLSLAHDTIYEDLANTTPDYSFLSDARNTCFQDKTVLASAIMRSSELRDRFIAFSSGEVVRWNVAALQEWLVSYARLQLLHLVRALTTSGSPSRGTELTAMTLVNTRENPIRNLVMFDKHLAFLTTYLKTSALTGHDKCIPHAVDGFQSSLLLQDLAIARPFAMLAVYISHPKPGPTLALYKRHIFVNHDRLFITTDITHALGLLSLNHLDVKLGVSDWRHVSTAFRRKHCSRMAELFEEDDMDSVQAQQSGHSRQTENRIYALSADAWAGASEDLLPLFLLASGEWQSTVRVVPGGLGLGYRDALASTFPAHVASGLIKPFRSVDTLEAKLEKVLSPLMSRLDRILQPADAIQHIMQQLESLSAKLDSIDRRRSESGTVNPLSSPTTVVVDSLPSPQESPSSALLEEAALSALRQVLGDPLADWKSAEQRQGVMAMLELKRDVIVITATGSGKSMLAIIPAMVETDRVTVLMLPLRSLRTDYVRKLDAMHVPFEIFAGGPISGQANLLIVSADSSKAHNWQQELAILNERKPVARLIFDEAHVPLMAASYRESLRNMFRVRTLPFQLALMSATIQPDIEPAVIAEFGLQDTLVIRSLTNRPELAYEWRPVVSSQEMLAASSLEISHWRLAAKPEERALVFVPTYAFGSQISSFMGVEFYSGHEETSDEQRLAMYDNWIKGVHKVMVCTSAFGAGNDYRHTRLVVHAGTPVEMVNYIQEVSRAGRDGQPSKCILIQSSFNPQSSAKNPPNSQALVEGPRPAVADFGGKEAMSSALQTQGVCIRSILTGYIDGAATFCSADETNNRCSVCKSSTADRAHDDLPSSHKRQICEPFLPAMQASKKRRVEDHSPAMEYATRLRNQLVRFSNTCMVCHVYGVEQPASHGLMHCPILKSLNTSFLKWREAIRITPASKVCFWCLVPQGPKDYLHPQFTASARSCEFRDLLLPFAFAMYSHPRHRQDTNRRFDGCMSSQDEFLKWIVGAPSAGHLSNLCALFLQYATGK